MDAEPRPIPRQFVGTHVVNAIAVDKESSGIIRWHAAGVIDPVADKVGAFP
jgi:hypothetical protein